MSSNSKLKNISTPRKGIILGALKTPHCVIASTGIPSRKGNICTNLLNYVVTEEQDFEGDGHAQVDECKENDNQTSSFCFSLTTVKNLQEVLRQGTYETYSREYRINVGSQEPTREAKSNADEYPTNDGHGDNTKDLR